MPERGLRPAQQRERTLRLDARPGSCKALVSRVRARQPSEEEALAPKAMPGAKGLRW